MKRDHRGVGAAVKWLILIVLLVLIVLPLGQVFLNSFRTTRELKRRPFGFPAQWHFENWLETWQAGDYGQAFVNSVVVSGVSIGGEMLIVGLAAFAIAKMKFKGRSFLDGYFFASMSISSFLYIVTDYFMLNKLGLINTHVGLILTHLARNIPFNLLILRTFISDIPGEIEESAKLDGCTDLQVFFRIIVPITKTIFFTVAILVFVATWNEYVWSNTFITSPALKTVNTRYVRFVGDNTSDLAKIYTASAITILPIIIVYLVFSRQFIDGMTSGSVKG